MGTMRFMSCPTATNGLPKMFSFDSSPGRAIAQALGAGVWDEHSYKSELKEDREDEKIYEVQMRKHGGPLVKVGTITHRPTLY